MRFDDTLGTVLAANLTTPAAAQAAWRQVVDLIGRRRAPADDRALAVLARIRDAVPVAVRAASARALFGARPPAPLVRLLTRDDIAVGAPVLRSAELSVDEWTALLPELTPTARAVLRHRRDLPQPVLRALESFGPVDFVIGSDMPVEVPASAPPVVQAPAIHAPSAEPEPVTVMPDPVQIDTGPFVSVGSIAMGLPVVAEALRRGNDNEAPRPTDGTFRISDVVARLEAFQRKREDAIASPPPPAIVAPVEAFRFRTDASGAIRWVEGVARGGVVGIDLGRPARPTEPGVDGIAAGAFRRRARFADAHLSLGGSGVAAGSWLISAVPGFDPATGRFTGYSGSARRPHRHERATAAPQSDSLRQLVHELRTPTNAIVGFSEMIEHQMLGPVAPPYRAQAVLMRNDAGGLLAAIDDLDAAARIDAGALPLHPEPVALEPMLRAIVTDLAPLAHARGAQVSLGEATGTVLADTRALERMVARLVGTMVGAAAKDEAIVVRGFEGAGLRIGLSVTRPAALDAHPGDAVLGIDDEDSPASLLGVGFALRLVRNLAREIGGTLTIGQRSLTLYLPAADGRALDRAGAS